MPAVFAITADLGQQIIGCGVQSGNDDKIIAGHLISGILRKQEVAFHVVFVQCLINAHQDVVIPELSGKAGNREIVNG